MDAMLNECGADSAHVVGVAKELKYQLHFQGGQQRRERAREREWRRKSALQLPI